MTPHDEWDYDGVNEMILSDQEINGMLLWLFAIPWMAERSADEPTRTENGKYFDAEGDPT